MTQHKARRANKIEFLHLPVTQSFFSTFNVSASGITAQPGPGTGSLPWIQGITIASDGTLLYTGSGQVWNVASKSFLGTFSLERDSGDYYIPGPFSILPEPSAGRTYFLTAIENNLDPPTLNVEAYDMNSFAKIGSI